MTQGIRIGEIVVVHAPADSLVPYDCYYSGPVVETRPGGLFVVEPANFRPMPERWRPYDGIKRILARKTDQTTGTHQLSYAGRCDTPAGGN